MGLIEFKNKAYEALTDFRNVKICLYIVLISYLSLLILGVILANLNPPAYTIWTNWISALGDYKDTPFFYLYDAACIIAGILTIPFTFYLEKTLAPEGNSSRMQVKLASFGWLFGLIGSVCYVFVGIFSEGRSVPYEGGSLHGLFSGITFAGFVLSAMFYGIIIIFYETNFPRGLGIYGLIGPFVVLALNLFGMPIFEWLLLFSILAWIIPLSLIIMHHGPD